MNRGAVTSLGLFWVLLGIFNGGSYIGWAFSALGGATVAMQIADHLFWRDQWRILYRQTQSALHTDATGKHNPRQGSALSVDSILKREAGSS